MRAFIIEDEPLARRRLVKLLEENFKDIEIVAQADSVADSIKWLRKNPDGCDVIFMDVELSDGECFEIFNAVAITAQVIMTTAYDNYAVKAFEVNSIDYLLKPIEMEALERAISRCRERLASKELKAMKAGAQPAEKARTYKERYLIKTNSRIVPIKVAEIAYFFSANKGTWLTVKTGENYVINPSLDEVTENINPEIFFRVSRNCLVAKDSISGIIKLSGSRLQLNVEPAPKFSIEVSRTRVDDFLKWMEE
jgi:DNA-binding LytR/AlgR family response regulator